MSQLTAKGFKRKRLDEIIADMETVAKELWGVNVNLSDRSNLGKFIRLVARERAKDFEDMEDVYNSAFYDTAVDNSLDKVAKRIGLTRIQENRATGTYRFVVDPGISIPQGIIVGTEGGVEFITTESGTESGGIIEVGIRAVNAGVSGNVPADTITVIKTPVPGILSGTNPEATEGGRNRETDEEFRFRYERSLAIGGSATAASVEAALLQLTDVKDAIVDQNEEDKTVNGLPPNCIAPYVYGGTEQEIAETIFRTKAGGIRSYGSVVVNVTDSRGKVHSIGFSRPTEVSVWVRITLTRTADYPTNGDDLVRTAVVQYIGGTDVDGTIYDGLGQGDDVIRYKISSAVGNVPGIDDLVVETSLTGNGTDWAQANVPIGQTSVAITTFDKVVVV